MELIAKLIIIYIIEFFLSFLITYFPENEYPAVAGAGAVAFAGAVVVTVAGAVAVAFAVAVAGTVTVAGAGAVAVAVAGAVAGAVAYKNKRRNIVKLKKLKELERKT